MDERGFTFVELLVAAALTAVVLLAVGSFYLFGSRSVADGHSQTFLQRQGTLILEELGREIRPALAVNIVNAASPPGTCADAIAADMVPGTNALAVDSGTLWCLYRNPAGGLIRCQFSEGACNSLNLLSGSPVPLRATRFDVSLLTPCKAKGLTCDGSTGLCSVPTYSGAIAPAASIQFTLTDGTNPPLPFSVTLTTLRHP